MTRVRIKQGELEGTLEKLTTGDTYVSFKGVPYAKPPIGDLRFRVCEYFMVYFFILYSIFINKYITLRHLNRPRAGLAFEMLQITETCVPNGT